MNEPSAASDYHRMELVGEGSFGKVYKGRRRFSGRVVAMKFIVKMNKSEEDLRGLRREIDILRALDHPGIVRLLDWFETDEDICVVTEFAQGELYEVLEDDTSLPEAVIRGVAADLALALHYLHGRRVIHRDMKPQNILIGAGGRAKLCDFGFARHMSSQTSVVSSIKGTPLYMAPELVQERPYNHTVDIWSLGVILYELAVGRPPFYTNSIFSLITLIVREPVSYPPGVGPELRSFLGLLLEKDPARRLGWPGLLEHPFVRAAVAERRAMDAGPPAASPPTPPPWWEGAVAALAAGEDPTAVSASFEPRLAGAAGALARAPAGGPAPPHAVEAVRGAALVARSVVDAGGVPSPAWTGFLLEAAGLLAARAEPADVAACLAAAHRVALAALPRSRGVPAALYERLLPHTPALLASGCALHCVTYLESVAAQSSLHAVSSPGFVEAVRGSRLPEALAGMLPRVAAGGGRGGEAARRALRCTALLLRCEEDGEEEEEAAATAAELVGVEEEDEDDDDNKVCAGNGVPTAGGGGDGPFAARRPAKVAAEARRAFLAACEIESRVLAAVPVTSLVRAAAEAAGPDAAALARDALFVAARAAERGPPEAAEALLADEAGRAAGLVASADGAASGGAMWALAAAAARVGDGPAASAAVFRALGREPDRALLLLAGWAEEGGTRGAGAAMLLARVLPHTLAGGGDLLARLILGSAARLAEAAAAARDSAAAPTATAAVRVLEGTGFGFPSAREPDPDVALLRAAASRAAATGGPAAEAVCGAARSCGVVDTLALACLSPGAGRARPLVSAFGVRRAAEAVLALLRAGHAVGAAGAAAWGERAARAAARLCDASRVDALARWPARSGGGAGAVERLVQCAVGIMFEPLSRAATGEDAARAQKLLYNEGAVPRLVDSLPLLTPRCVETAAGFLGQLVMCSDHFADQFVESGGLQAYVACCLLGGNGGVAGAAGGLGGGAGEEAPDGVVVQALQLVSHMARRSGRHLEAMAEAGVVACLVGALGHASGTVRARACNLAGNLCRHSGALYDEFLRRGVVPALVLCLGARGPEEERKFACFALGNAAYHGAALYEQLRVAVPRLVELVLIASDKTRANAAGALGNLARNSDAALGDLLAARAVEALTGVACDAAHPPATRRIALFSLGNVAGHEAGRERVAAQGVARLGRATEDADQRVAQYARRLAGKLARQQNV